MVNMTLFQIALLAATKFDVNAAMHIVNLCGAIAQKKPSKHGTGGRMMARLIDADRALEIVRDQGIAHPNAYHLTNYATLILREAPTVDAVPVSELKKLRDYLYAEDLIFMRGLAELNKLIANCGAKMDGSSNEE